MTTKEGLSLDAALLAEARQAATAAGTDLDGFVGRAVQEKLWALHPERYFAARAERADIEKAKAILKRAGVGNTPVPGDEIDPDAS